MLVEIDSEWHGVIREALEKYLEHLNENQNREDSTLLELHQNLKKKKTVTEILYRMQLSDTTILELRSK